MRKTRYQLIEPVKVADAYVASGSFGIFAKYAIRQHIGKCRKRVNHSCK